MDAFWSFHKYKPQAFTFWVLFTVFVCLLAVLIVVLWTKNRRKKSVLLLLWMYLVVLVTYIIRIPRSNFRSSLILFSSLKGGTYLQSIENVMLFIPGGFLSFQLNKTFIKAVACGGLFSLWIEITQFLTKRGWFEIDDLIFNILGMVIGYIICMLYYKIKK